MSWHRPVLVGASSLVLLSLTSCFEAPVREELRLRFLPNGAVVATSTVRVTDPEGSNPALARRLAEARQALLEGSDPWEARFAAASPGAERFSWEKRLGTLSAPDEVSHLIYDPFPARLTLKLPAKPQAVEGFLKADDDAFTVASPGLWEALSSLEGRWLSPDPVLVYVESARQGEESSFDLSAFLAKPRRSAPSHLLPSAHEARVQIESRLKPAPLYRMAWQIKLADEAPFHWETAEAP